MVDANMAARWGESRKDQQNQKGRYKKGFFAIGFACFFLSSFPYAQPTQV